MKNIEQKHKTITELEEYLVKRYGAKLEKEIDESRVNTIKSRIVHKYYINLLPGERVLTDPIDGMTNEKEEELLEEMRFIRNIPNEMINLELVNYEFDVYSDSINIGKFEVLIDITTSTVYPEYTLKVINENCKREMFNICGDILLYQGVSRVDIAEKNQRYMEYITTKHYYESW